MSVPMVSTKYFLLLALAVGPQHGTAMRKQMLDDTLGYWVRDSSLYDCLKSMLSDGLIEQINVRDPVRKVYRLTDKGERLLALEVRTHKRAAELGWRRLKLHL